MYYTSFMFETAERSHYAENDTQDDQNGLLKTKVPTHLSCSILGDKHPSHRTMLARSEPNVPKMTPEMTKVDFRQTSALHIYPVQHLAANIQAIEQC